jgi:DNA polymerase-3 subunit delta'
MKSSVTFAELLGQEKAKSLLRRALQKERLGHAYLFKGPVGTGKKRAATCFAALLNCLQPTADDACGRCPSCLKIAGGSHPDFLVIAAEGATIKINQIRELKKILGYPPFEASRRVVLLADIQHMGREAANSLLKTLEEPPSHTILLLTVDEANDTLATILSRCQTIPIAPLVESELVPALQKMHADLDRDTVGTVAALAEGSLGRAGKFLEQGLISFRLELVENLTNLQPDTPETARAVLRLAEKTAELKEELPQLLELLALWLRDLLLVTIGCPERIINRDLASLLVDACKQWRPEQIMQRLAFIDKAKKQLASNCNRTMVCEVLFFNLL